MTTPNPPPFQRDDGRSIPLTRTLLTVPELMQALKISRATLYRLMSKGLPALKVGQHTRFDPVAVSRWLEALRQGETVLTPGDYRCVGCGWLGHVPHALRLEALGPCPACGVKGKVTLG